MVNKEKVIKGLEICYCPPSKCEDCPYDGVENCNDTLCLDALSILKEQDNCENCAIAIEDRQLVVRCKDCKHWLPTDRFDHDYHSGRGQCEWNCWVRDFDWFCADGERR